MSKREDFLMMVQTDTILHFNNQLFLSNKGFNVWDLAKYSGYMGDAILASDRIPDDMDSRDAAAEFMQFFYYQHMDSQDEMSCPNWLANLG